LSENTSAKRIAPVTPASELFTLASMVLSLPHNLEADAAVVVRGLGLELPLRCATKELKDLDASYLIVAAANSTEKTYRHYDKDDLRAPPFNVKPRVAILTNRHMDHTASQAAWIAEQIGVTNIKTAVLYAPAYHMVRAYCTVLKGMLKAGQYIVLLPRPVPMPPWLVVPENGQDAYEMAHAEAPRILAYQQKGDVVTLSELREYLDWVWKQPPLCNIV